MTIMSTTHEDRGYAQSPVLEKSRDTEKESKVSNKLDDSASVVSAVKAKWDCTNWDLNTQQPHGGQEWAQIDNFVEDFSVTTNTLGPPWKAVAAATAALSEVEHYPPANCEPHLTRLAKFLDPFNAEDIHSCLMLGNGASELIDLVTRVGAHPGNVCIPNSVQYKEYERAALADGITKIESMDTKPCAIMAIVNPCNPTGEYKRVDEMKKMIEACNPGTTVLVDESMQPWVGDKWRDDSLVRQREWVKRQAESRDVRVFVIHSWTKIWSCPGIRLGSILAPTRGEVVQMRTHQVPWSVNICALAFLTAAVGDSEYLQHTWSITQQWRQRTVDKLVELHPTWEVKGEPFLSWLWVDTKDERVADMAVRRCKDHGTPIRHGKHGYEQATYIRIAVRSPEKQDILFAALSF